MRWCSLVVRTAGCFGEILGRLDGVFFVKVNVTANENVALLQVVQSPCFLSVFLSVTDELAFDAPWFEFGGVVGRRVRVCIAAIYP